MSLAVEAKLPKRCMRIRYEDIVKEPRVQVERLCSFIGVPGEGDTMQSALRERHLHGHGDHKIPFADEVQSDSVGRGSMVPIHMIPAGGIENINGMLAELGYDPLGPDWNLAPNVLRRDILPAGEQEDRWKELQLLLDLGIQGIPQINTEGHLQRVILVVEELASRGGWLLDISEPSVKEVQIKDDSAPVVITRMKAIATIGNPAADVAELVERGDLRIRTNLGIQAGIEAAKLVKMILATTADTAPVCTCQLSGPSRR